MPHYYPLYPLEMMDAFIQILISHGLFGMFISSFLAGSILPFSSEVVMAGLQVAGASPVGLFIGGTLGNTLGTLVNYWIGSLGKEEWITKYLKLPPAKLEKGKQYVVKYGAWAGILTWLPILGEALAVAMGYLRTPLWFSILAMLVGKGARYAVILFLIGQL